MITLSLITDSRLELNTRCSPQDVIKVENTKVMLLPRSDNKGRIFFGKTGPGRRAEAEIASSEAACPRLSGLHGTGGQQCKCKAPCAISGGRTEICSLTGTCDVRVCGCVVVPLVCQPMAHVTVLVCNSVPYR